MPQHAYVFGIFVAQLMFKFLYRRWVFPDKAVRVEEKIAFLVICVSLNCGPEGRSLYCLNLNCRAPPGQFLQLDLTGWWQDV